MLSAGSKNRLFLNELNSPYSCIDYKECKRMLGKARAELKRASDHLFNLCCLVQSEPQQVDPEDLTLALRSYREAAEFAETLEALVESADRAAGR